MLPPQRSDKAEQARVKETYKQMVRPCSAHLHPSSLTFPPGKARNLPRIPHLSTIRILPLHRARPPRMRKEVQALRQPPRRTVFRTAHRPTPQSARRYPRPKAATCTVGLGPL
jgi:hypothetical protein